ncbi:MAG: toxin-antitoxin system YwqK family antitoxin [Verrucomicrobia bacterium]|nr:toxin-antitoxin system YwqK family antitoxin [Verrucomicrobiota bacterium]
MSTTVQKSYYRNGQLREELPLRNGRKHGVVRIWHKNGALASEEPHQDGLLHGLCRQWDEAGRLLGEYLMEHGTGVQRAWHDNGQLQLEVSTIGGEFSGKNRLWLRDGTLISERIYLFGRIVTAEEYRAAAKNDPLLPKLQDTPATRPTKSQARQLHIHRVFVASLLEKANRSEAREWFQTEGKTARSLGRFKRETDAVKFVERLYAAGAVEVIVPDIYSNNARDQFADDLLVHLPTSPGKRENIRRVCAQLRKRRLGAVEPTEDIGESCLYLSFA